MNSGRTVKSDGVGTSYGISRMQGGCEYSFSGRVKRSGFFTRFCVFVAGCAKVQVGAKKKQV